MITVEEENEIAAFANYQSGAVVTVSAAAPQVQEPIVVLKPSEIKEEKSSHTTTTTSSNNNSANDRIFISPLARKLLKESGTPLHEVRDILASASSNGIVGSGTSGRIVAADVVKAAALPRKATTTASTSGISTSKEGLHTTDTTYHRGSSSNIQGVYDDFLLSDQSIALAKRYTIAKQAVPHYYLSVELNLTKLLKLRSEFNSQLASTTTGGKKGGGGTELSVLDFLIKASALAMKHVRRRSLLLFVTI